MYTHSDPLYQLAGKKYLNKQIFLTFDWMFFFWFSTFSKKTIYFLYII